jgi:multidrug efflux system membrane fusion protein
MAARRRFRWGLLAVGVLVVALVLWVILRPAPPKPHQPPPTAVTVAVAKVQDVPVSITALGAAQAWRNVTIHAQVSGKLLSAPFTEGTTVRAGQLLAQIDPAPYRAALMQARGALARDQAMLENARIDLARDRTLAAQDSIARQTADTQAALVKQDEGVVLSDQGTVAAARVNLGWTRITAPIGGRLGVRLVDPGNLVSASDATGIVTLDQIEPIAVTFTVPEGDFQRLVDLSNGFRTPLATEALSQETGAPLATGELSIADNHVDPSTGTVTLKARFPNTDHRLWPGQFVDVRLTLNTLRAAIVVPAAAVNQGPRGPFVYAVGGDGKAVMRPVRVAVTQGDLAVIAQGLSAGDTVVTDGQLTLKPGAAVKARQAAAPNAAGPGVAGRAGA